MHTQARTMPRLCVAWRPFIRLEAQASHENIRRATGWSRPPDVETGIQRGLFFKFSGEAPDVSFVGASVCILRDEILRWRTNLSSPVSLSRASSRSYWRGGSRKGAHAAPGPLQIRSLLSVLIDYPRLVSKRVACSMPIGRSILHLERRRKRRNSFCNIPDYSCKNRFEDSVNRF